MSQLSMERSSTELDMLTEEDKAQLQGMTILEEDWSDVAVPMAAGSKPILAQGVKKKFAGPPRPKNRDGMGRYIVPAGKKPLTVLDYPTPGPMDYNANDTPIIKRNPTFPFGEKQEPRRKKGNPAPNAYKTGGNMVWGKCKRITIKEKFPTGELNYAKNKPGPKYLPKKTALDGPKYSVRFKPADPRLPGLTSSLAQDPDPTIPGPDFNPSECEWRQKPQTFGLKYPDLKQPSGPGPGKYWMPDKSTAPKWSMGLAKHDPFKDLDKNSPSAGQYSAKSTIGMAPKYTMGKRLQPPKARFPMPGPDMYHRGGFRLDEPGYTLQYRWFDSTPEPRPGPNSYRLNVDAVKVKAPAYSFSDKRPPTYPSSVYANDKSWTPAPGQYNLPPTPKKPGRSIGIKYKETTNRVPGPADYQDPERFKVALPKAPAYSMRDRYVEYIDEAPGPSCYRIKYQDRKPGKTFGTKQESQVIYCGPGPAYNTSMGKPCQITKGVTLKSRSTPHQYVGLQDNQHILPRCKDIPEAPLLG